MKMKPPVMPPRSEWDFGNIPANLYALATVYEYARESEPLRKGICAWFQTPHDGETRAEKLVQALKRKDGNKFGDIVYPAGNDLLEATHHNFQLSTIISSCPLFPKPFLSCGHPAIELARTPEKDRPKSKSRSARVSISSITDWVKPKWCTEGYWQFLETNVYALSINWEQATVKEIIRDFAKCLSKEAKNHPELKARGKGGQVKPAPLIWLAALRISNAGFSYEDARPRLPIHQLSPIFDDKSGWYRAIKKAKDLLQELEAGKRIVVL